MDCPINFSKNRWAFSLGISSVFLLNKLEDGGLLEHDLAVGASGNRDFSGNDLEGVTSNRSKCEIESKMHKW